MAVGSGVDVLVGCGVVVAVAVKTGGGDCVDFTDAAFTRMSTSTSTDTTMISPPTSHSHEFDFACGFSYGSIGSSTIGGGAASVSKN